ncbi:MAG: alpha-N-acetylglucosaminidase [Alistipes sp.]|nr:alpha-N-acetylglucosaminidase [Alistipes sp.]
MLMAACNRSAPKDEVVAALLERIAPGSSHKFIIERIEGDKNGVFEIEGRNGKVVIRGSDTPAITAGVHHYLKYCAHASLSRDCMTAHLPEKLPVPEQKIRRQSLARYRYAYNYCTFSYSSAFWGWEQWEREIDLMALHGVNMPLMTVGTEAVWRNLLLRRGYDETAIGRFIAGPAFQAWWLMGNLEGWGGPCSAEWYADREELAKKILARMRELGMEPVLPGYYGMMPSDTRQRTDLDVTGTGEWCGFTRPLFLKPDDEHFGEIADQYYEESERLYGSARFYSCDPFHEGGSTKGVDLAASGRAILGAMKRRREDAVWVLQAWQKNPQKQMIDSLPPGDIIILDLFSESRPQWGEPSSVWHRPGGFGRHEWIYCMLLNFGNNTGLHGKMEYLAEGFRDAMANPQAGATLAGTGMTAEGTDNNPVMYEMLAELPWGEVTDSRQWLRDYCRGRYGADDSQVLEAWQLLARSVYGCPKSSTQEGTNESVFCARPVLNFRQTSAFSGTRQYYDPEEVIEAARIMVAAAGRFGGCEHFAYDLVDIVRQAVAEQGRIQQRAVAAAFRRGDREAFAREAERFIALIDMQDELLGTLPQFMLGTHIAQARALGHSDSERALLEWNLRVQITAWGTRRAADEGLLRDYAHKEWNGLLGSLYRRRWQVWFDAMARRMEGEKVAPIDFYAMEEEWSRGTESYPSEPLADPVQTATKIMERLRNEYRPDKATN